MSGVAICLCHMRSRLANPGTAHSNPAFHQRVRDVSNRGIRLNMCVTKTDPRCMSVIQQLSRTTKFHMCLLQMWCNSVPRDLLDRGPYVARSSGPNAEVRLHRQRRPHANHRLIDQDLCRHKKESGNHLVLRCNNDIAVCSWPIHGC